MYLITTLLFCYIFGTRIVLTTDSESVNEAEEFEKFLAEEDGLVVLFTQPCCACAECVEAEVLIGGMSQQLEDNLGLLVVRIKDENVKSRYGIKKVPAIAYIRNNKTALYDGKYEYETLYSWLQDNRQPSTVDLDDTSFEHLTQAASGATTGDWLVLFHDGTCCKKRELIKLENAGIKLRNRVNVASVNILKAHETAVRFNITTCPQIILFRHHKMYQFTISEISVKTLKNFAEGFYKNSKAAPVPQPLTVFDKILDMSVIYFREHPIILVISMVVTFVSAPIFVKLYVKYIISPPKQKSQ